MARSTDMEVSRRIRTVAQWIIEGNSYTDIVHNIAQTWGVEERQSKNYISKALDLFKEENQDELEQKIAFHKRARMDNYRLLVEQRTKTIKNENLSTYKKVQLVCMLSNQINTTLRDIAKIDGVFIEKVDHTSKGEKINTSENSFEITITKSETKVNENSTPQLEEKVTLLKTESEET
jgi:hypothetical protein